MRLSVPVVFSVALAACTATVDKCRAEIPDSSAKDGIGYTTILAKTPEGKVINTAVAPYDINVDCVRKSGESRWIGKHPIYAFHCTMETEGDGNEGSAGRSTFIWTFKKVSPHLLELVSVGNSKVGTYAYRHSYDLLRSIARIDPNK